VSSQLRLAVACREESYLVEMVAEESGAGNESVLVTLNCQFASDELDRHVGGSGGVAVSASCQWWRERCGQNAFHLPVHAEGLILQLVRRHVGSWSVVSKVRTCLKLAQCEIGE